MTIKDIINTWDPYSLFPLAPSDEYSFEISKIEQSMKNDNINESDLERYIKSLFDSDLIEKNKRDFSSVARRIFALNTN